MTSPSPNGASQTTPSAVPPVAKTVPPVPSTVPPITRPPTPRSNVPPRTSMKPLTDRSLDTIRVALVVGSR